MAAASRVDLAAASTAVEGLLAWFRSRESGRKAQLLEDDEPIYLFLSLRRIPAARRTNPYLFRLPHPVLADPSLCILLPDGLETDLPPLPFTSPPKLIPLSTLRSDYVPFEARRRLCSSYDLFLADRRIITFLPRLLGKHFFSKKKHPLRIDLSHGNLAEKIETACASARMYVSTGTCMRLQVGRVSMPRSHILENIAVVLEEAVARVPKGWSNVRGLYLKLEESVALPIYQALPELGLKIDVAQSDRGGSELLDTDGRDEGEKKVDGKGRMKKKKKKKSGLLGETRYMDAQVGILQLGHVEESEDEHVEEEEGNTKIKGDGRKRKKVGRGQREEDPEKSSMSSERKMKKKGKKKTGDEGVAEDDVVDGGGTDYVVKSVDGKRKEKRKKKLKGEVATGDFEDVLKVVSDNIDGKKEKKGKAKSDFRSKELKDKRKTKTTS